MRLILQKGIVFDIIEYQSVLIYVLYSIPHLAIAWCQSTWGAGIKMP